MCFFNTKRQTVDDPSIHRWPWARLTNGDLWSEHAIIVNCKGVHTTKTSKPKAHRTGEEISALTHDGKRAAVHNQRTDGDPGKSRKCHDCFIAQYAECNEYHQS